MRTFLLPLGTLVTFAAAGCNIAGDWVQVNKSTASRTGYYEAIDLSNDPHFNLMVNFDIRHSLGEVFGSYSASGGVELMVPSSLDGANIVGNTSVTGTFDSSCSVLTWSSETYWAPTWCRAWTPGCVSPPAPYGKGMSFWKTFGNNMVLQRAPAAAAVYGVYGLKPVKGASVAVTITGEGINYTVTATMESVQQAVGPEYEYAIATGSVDGPYASWKAMLKPTIAGGNYTITAVCSNCGTTADTATITNVTFGDVWHCSGQSNMWLPLDSTFNQNETMAAVLSGKYSNMRAMMGNSGYGNDVASNPWMTAQQATQLKSGEPILLNFGATCWYFGQKITDLSVETTSNGEAIPLGLINTAIGGQRIEEYMVNDTSFYVCSPDGLGQEATGSARDWNGMLWAKMILPFVDMTTFGFLWYQGENNMGEVKGNSVANVGYGCYQRVLVEGWRKAFNNPTAPFGIVTLASSGSESGPNMGAMRMAQTANYGILPNAAMPNTFFAQAYDLDDEWGPASGPCFNEWQCCTPYNDTACRAGTNNKPSLCTNACNSAYTPTHGAIHPRSKKQVGDRLGNAYYNAIAGGTAAFTGPTLAGCVLSSTGLTINFDTNLLKNDKLKLNTWSLPWTPPIRHAAPLGGSFLFVQTNATEYCNEAIPARNSTGGRIAGNMTCPKWAGGTGAITDNINYNSDWIMLNFTLASSGTGVEVDLSPLNGSVPTAVRYAWGIVQCCNHADPTLYVTHGCIADCPIYSATAGLPANPFQARIVNNKCECVAPQVCS